MPRPLYPREGIRVPVVHEDGWPTGSVWAGVEKRKFYILYSSTNWTECLADIWIQILAKLIAWVLADWATDHNSCGLCVWGWAADCCWLIRVKHFLLTTLTATLVNSILFLFPKLKYTFTYFVRCCNICVTLNQIFQSERFKIFTKHQHRFTVSAVK